MTICRRERAFFYRRNSRRFRRQQTSEDSLAEAYMTSGNSETAIRYYEKSIDFVLNNKDAVERLKNLKP